MDHGTIVATLHDGSLQVAMPMSGSASKSRQDSQMSDLGNVVASLSSILKTAQPPWTTVEY